MLFAEKLGRSLAQLQKYDEARCTMLIALQQNPNFREAHLRLALLYERQLNNPQQAMQHRKLAKQLAHSQQQAGKESPIDNNVNSSPHKLHLSRTGDNTDRDTSVITIVTGLPRSGTSMMMQMLSAGGMEIITDDIRTADNDNPRGYFELQEATQLHRESDWISSARGKTVKIVAHLLRHLPANFSYKIIFMERNLNEVLLSQRAMLDRQQKEGAAITDNRLRKTFSRQLQQIHDWLDRQENIDTLFVNYNRVLEDPGKTAEAVSDFLDRRLSIPGMSCVVDPTLYRQKKRSTR